MKQFESMDDILDFAIQQEQEAVDFYNLLSGNAKNEDMKKVFLQFAQEEIGHKAMLTKIKQEGILSSEVKNITDLKISNYVSSIEPKEDMTYQEALVLAMNREKNAFKLYSDLAEKATSQEMKNIFLTLAQEESKHKLRFELEYDEFVLKDN